MSAGGGMEIPKVVGWQFPSRTRSAEVQAQWFCSGVAAVCSDVIKIKIIDCLRLYFKWCFIMLTLSARRKRRG